MPERAKAMIAHARHTREWSRQLMADTRKLREEAQTAVRSSRSSGNGNSPVALFALEARDTALLNGASSPLAGLTLKPLRRSTDPEEDS